MIFKSATAFRMGAPSKLQMGKDNFKEPPDILGKPAMREAAGLECCGQSAAAAYSLYLPAGKTAFCRGLPCVYENF